MPAGPQAGPALAVHLLCPQQDTSWEHAGLSHADPAHAAAHSCDRLRGPQPPSCPAEGSRVSLGCAAEGSWKACGRNLSHLTRVSLLHNADTTTLVHLAQV